MLDPDYGPFERAFRRVCGAFRLKLKPEEFEELSRTYFKVLEDADFADVMAAGKTCLSTCRSFPKPMEWLAALPRHPVVKPAENQRAMGVTECAEYRDAEHRHWTGDLCDCLMCQAAGVTHLPLRFVPEFDQQDQEVRAFDVVRGRIVVVGHWAHGAELAAWYRARDQFFGHGLAAVVVAAVPALVRSREPGEDG